MASTKAGGREATAGSEDVLYRDTTPDEASELIPNLSALTLEEMRVSSAQSTGQQAVTEASTARGEVCPPSGASLNSESAERRPELTSR